MAYTKQTWLPAEDGTTPFSAARMTYIEEGIETAQETADAALVASGGSGVAFAGALLRLNADVSIPTANVNQAINWDTVVENVGGWVNLGTHPSRITVPAGASGRAVLTANVRFKSGTTGARAATLQKNGATVAGGGQFTAQAGTGFTVTTGNLTSFPLVLTPGDYYEIIVVSSTTGQSLDAAGLHTWFGLHVVPG